ncbi:MAG: DUF6460 domain-containing protein [Pseudomonadota bacterium]|nr:DUF6460 domain-containing protein [Pseudomonadota bacterium]
MTEQDLKPKAQTRDDLKTRFLGRSLTRTLVSLAVASIVVGALLNFIGVTPGAFWSGFYRTVRGVISALGDSIGEVIGTLVTYLLIGAAIVLPIWFVSRLFSGRKK